MALVLHAGQGNKNAYKSLIAAEYCGVEVEHEKEFQMGVSDKTPVFLKSNPVGEFPVLEILDGPLVESNSMARYVAKLKGDGTLCGSSVYEYVLIEQWMAFAATEIDEGLQRWIYPRMGVYPYNAQFEAVAIACLKRALVTLDNHLATNTYLVGHSITLADIVMTCDLYFGFTRIMTKSFTSEFPHVERYFWAFVNQRSFKKILGEVKQAESMPALPDWTPLGEVLVDQEMIEEARNKHRVNQMIEAQDKLRVN